MANKLLDKLENAFNDATSIDVVTLTGNLEVSVGAGEDIDIETFYAKLKENVGTMKIVGVTHRELTFDELNFIAPLGEAVTTEMRELHKNSVAAATDARDGLVKSVIETVAKIAS